jgi:hypothetical protein
MNLKEVNLYDESFTMENNDVILVDNTKDYENFKKLNYKVLNINNLHKNLDNNTFITELDKLLFISKYTNKLTEKTIEIGNFITELELYEIKIDDLDKYTEEHGNKNLLKIKQIYLDYKEYKKNNNLYDMSDGIKKSLNLKFKINNLYLFNILFTDKLRNNLIFYLIKLSKNNYILKENNINLSYQEKKYLNIKDYKNQYNSKYLLLENKYSIFNFLNQFKDFKPEDIGIIKFNNLNNILPSINYKEFNFILSFVNFYYQKNDKYDFDNIEEFYKEKTKEKIDIILKKSKNINNLFNNLYLKHDFHILQEITKLKETINIIISENKDEEFSLIKNIFHTYLINNKNQKYLNNFNFKNEINNKLELISLSQINSKKIVFVLNSSLKKQKDSFLSNFHRKELNLVDSNLYIELQKNYKEILASYENVVFIDYKYKIEGLNEDLLYFKDKLELFKNPLKIKINKNKININNNDFLKYIDKISINHLYLINTDLNKLKDNYLDLDYDYLGNMSKNKIINIKNKIINNFIFTNKIDNVKSDNLLLKKELLILENKLNNNKNLFNLYKDYNSNKNILVETFIEELNRKINIEIKVDLFKEYEEEIDIIFYDKEPFTWQNKYHKTNYIKELLKIKYNKKINIIYLNLI